MYAKLTLANAKLTLANASLRGNNSLCVAATFLGAARLDVALNINPTS